jgi:hypothetical protein
MSHANIYRLLGCLFVTVVLLDCFSVLVLETLLQQFEPELLGLLHVVFDLGTIQFEN